MRTQIVDATCEAHAACGWGTKWLVEARAPPQLDQLLLQLAFDVDLGQARLGPPADLEELVLLRVGVVILLMGAVVLLVGAVVLLLDVVEHGVLLLHVLEHVLLLLHQLPAHPWLELGWPKSRRRRG